MDACRLYGGQYDRDLAIIRDVGALTMPGECVMDAKGETIFRRRPYYYAFEGFTEERIERGLLANTPSLSTRSGYPKRRLQVTVA